MVIENIPPISFAIPPCANLGGSIRHRFYPAKLLSRILVLILVILSPITFSNNSIPNFQPDCETACHISVGSVRKTAISAPGRRKPARIRTSAAKAKQLSTPILQSANHNPPSPSRAPPSVAS